MATAVLSANELRVAVRHELGHRPSWDNLKRLLINATPFPGMSGIERAWGEAAELAADDSAVETREDAPWISQPPLSSSPGLPPGGPSPNSQARWCVTRPQSPCAYTAFSNGAGAPASNDVALGCFRYPPPSALSRAITVASTRS